MKKKSTNQLRLPPLNNTFLHNLQYYLERLLRVFTLCLPFFIFYIMTELLKGRKIAADLGIHFNNFEDLYYVVLACSSNLFGRMLIGQLIKDKLYLRIERIYDYSIWDFKKRRIVHSVVSLSWYTIASISGIFISWNSEVLPSCILSIGSGKCQDLMMKWPSSPNFSYWKIYHTF